tara:strand:- start:155 stop:583 length:429 start_codon:yes stop_codon:yes gene_type:complete
MGEILSYRGKLADGGQDTILLSTKKGEAGYRIVKFEIMPIGINQNLESVTKIYKVEQAAVDSNIDFSDTTLLGAAILKIGTSPSETLALHTIFDREIFNQDIYVTSIDDAGSKASNYYIELERIKLSDHEAMVATIQNIRNG